MPRTPSTLSASPGAAEARALHQRESAHQSTDRRAPTGPATVGGSPGESRSSKKRKPSKRAVATVPREIDPITLEHRDGALHALTVHIPVATENEANLSSPFTPFAQSSYRKRVRRGVAQMLALLPKWEHLPVAVTLIRHSSGSLDRHDGLRNAFKSVVDELALYLPLPRKMKRKKTKRGIVEYPHADDSDPRVEWLYDQARCKPGQTWVTVRIERREGQP